MRTTEGANEQAQFGDIVELSRKLGRGFDFKISDNKLIVGYSEYATDLEQPITFPTGALREYRINMLVYNIKQALGLLHRDAKPPGLFSRGTNRANDTYYG